MRAIINGAVDFIQITIKQLPASWKGDRQSDEEQNNEGLCLIVE
jgi:hypothetical protein